ncbi:hypothetical protein [Rossellomorea sp. BNER]|uniref:hypothetical protein n=1 Tax=Rossellomorea sp. BNER TaxID=2962031 RepID=UPI003AF2879A|nr:DUF4309 domain-containing protein [Rossellomorea sp. BNER]
MNDPLKQLKSQLDKEVFSKGPQQSQKREIFKRIESINNRHKPFKLQLFIPSLAFIMILLIGAVLFLNEMDLDDSKENVKEEETTNPETIVQKSYLNSEDLYNQMLEEKQQAKDNAKINKGTENEKEESSNKSSVDVEETVVEEAEALLDPKKPSEDYSFSLSSILNNKEAFFQAARDGVFYNTDFRFGIMYDEIKKKYGEPDKEGVFTEGGWGAKYGDYHINMDFDRINPVSNIYARNTDQTTIKQVINSFGKPYFYPDFMVGVVGFGYQVGNNTIHFSTKGSHEVTVENGVEKIIAVDGDAVITRVTLDHNEGHLLPGPNEVKFLDEVSFRFQSKWFTTTKEALVKNKVFLDASIVSQNHDLIFEISVKDETTKAQLEEISHQFLLALTKQANKDIQQTIPDTSIWDRYTYEINFYKDNNGKEEYFSHITGNQKMTDHGYPEWKFR